MGWIRRLRSTLASARTNDVFDEEARFHLERRIDEYVARGMSPDRARQEATRRFGNLTLSRERARDADTLPWLRDFGHDLRYASRQLRRNPAFALTTILILAIGLGANTALFTVVDELLLKTLPVQAPHQLVLFNWLEGRQRMRTGMDGVRTDDEATGRGTSTSFSYPTFLRLREANRTLSELFAFYPIQQLNVVSDGRAEIASGQYVSGNYYRGLGVHARLGRTIADADDRPGAPPVATLTYRYWQRRFDSDPDVIGRSVLINRSSVTIVGVTPPAFAGALEVTQTPDVTLAFAAEPLMQGAGSDLGRPAFLWLHVMGRLRPGVTPDQAAASMNETMQQSMLDEWREATSKPGSRAGAESARTLDDGSTLRAESGARGLMDSRRRYAEPLFLLTGCAALVLLVTCMNLANLLLARGTARHREIATRMALGARRGRVVRQLFTDSLLLATVGSLGGLALARWGTDLLLIWSPWGGPVVLDNTLNWRVLAFCGIVAVVTSLLFGLVPALRATRADLSQFTRRAAGGTSPLTRALVIAQVAVSVVLLVAAALFVGTLRNLRAVDMGFNADQLLLFRVQPQLDGYERSEIAALYTRMMERIESVPGVRAATVSRHPLLSFSRRTDSVTFEGAPSGAGAQVNVVAPNYFRTLDIPLLLGRPFDDSDGPVAPRVAIVNQRFAAKYFEGRNPIGRTFWLGNAQEGDPIEIVGVARDAKYADLRNPTEPTLYVPVQQDVPGQANFSVRTVGEPVALAAAVRQAVREIDPNLPLFDVRSQTDQAQQSVAKETVFARLSAFLGSIALLLVAIGLYGTLSYAVLRRTAEIGVRMALGARRSAVIGMMLRDALVMTSLGLALGIPAAMVASRASDNVLDQILFGLEPTDPFALGGAAMLLIVVALLAGLLPARRASNVDPIVALRAE